MNQQPDSKRAHSIDELVQDRPLLPFLPLIYVAWADGELSSGEIEAIAEQVASQGGLDPGCRRRLAGWLDPADPPSPRELAAILRTIRQIAPALPDDAKLTLAGLGCHLVEKDLDGRTMAADPVVESTLADLEAAVGLAGAEASRELLSGARPAPEGEPERERASFSPSVLQESLDAPYASVRDRVRQLLSESEFHYQWEMDRASHRRLVTRWCRRLAEEGLGALSFPGAYGGADDLGAFIAVFETLAHHDSSLLVKFGVQFGLFGGSVLQLGTERHHRAYLESIGNMSLPGCFAMSETGHGSNVQELETVARYDSERREFVITTPTPGDRKDWIGNAAVDGKMATVFAQLRLGEDDFGVHAFLVPIRGEDGEVLPGVAIEDCGRKEGLNGVDNGRITFTEVRIPRENLLDRFASVSAEGEYSSAIASSSKRFFTMLGTLVGGRISVAGASIASAKTGLAIAIRYATRRRQFGAAGRPETLLLDYKAHQRKLLPRLAAVFAIDFAHKRLVRRFLAAGDEARKTETFAAGLKAYASWFNVETLQVCREACGGQGYLVENRICRLRDDTDAFTTFEGDNTVLMLLVAKSRLTEYRHQFSDLRLGGLVKLMASKAIAAVSELNPVVTRTTDDEHLQDFEFLAGAFRYRENRLLQTLAQRLRNRLERGMETFEAFNDCQDHALRMAEAHVERVVAEAILAAASDHRGRELGHILDRLACLFCLWRLETRRGWFLANGYFEGPKAKAIRNLITRIAQEVRPEAEALVESFGIPDRILAAPIAVREAGE
ncbi:MAG: acyl-CoA oxidase [bacterium]|nr:acyl-CoA oxidase [bacterium]